MVIVYLSLQSISPILHLTARRCRSHVIDTGLWVDFVSLWSFAVSSLVPVHLYMASGDIPNVSVAVWVTLYTLLLSLLGLNVVLFVRFTARFTSCHES